MPAQMQCIPVSVFGLSSVAGIEVYGINGIVIPGLGASPFCTD